MKRVALENIEKVLDRGEQLHILVEKSDDLRDSAVEFNMGATQLKHTMMCQYFKSMCFWNSID